MVKNLLLALLAIIFAAILTFGLNHYFKSARGDFFVLEQGKQIPNFKFEDRELYDFKGKTVIIHFWASWCAPCVVEFPELIALANKRDDIVILAFSSDRNQNQIDRFIDRYEFDIPNNMIIVLDEGQTITEGKFSVFRLPESFIIKPDMTMDNHIIGAYQGWAYLK